MTRLLPCLVLAGATAAFAADPTVSNVVVSQRAGTNLVDISYSLADPDTPSVAVSLAVSTNAGLAFNVACPSVAGDVGAGVVTGATRQIVWNGGTDLPGVATTQLRVRVTADDGTAPADMALIPAGSFAMGNCMVPGEGNGNELPVHTVMVSAFYMDKHEVSYTLWSNVHAWAIANGYTFDHAGAGKATNHPVQTVSWYDCVKWCNARSEMQGFTRCYYLDAGQTVVYRTGQSNIWNGSVKWTANGYRLPTEAEWEKAARGGTPGHRFPWSDADTISHARANYYADTNTYAYDVSTTQGYHPTFNDAVYPYTSPVGYFAPNGYGLYDMAGNVWEWTWDWYDGAWYGNAGATQSDTRGPVSGAYRVLRGGLWSDGAYLTRCANRVSYYPVITYGGLGFRCCRGL